MSNNSVKFWYTIGQPRNLPCWEVNPILWESFKDWTKLNQNIVPERNVIYTEEYIVQFLDSKVQDEQMEIL